MLKSIPEKQAYNYIIDSYRPRVEDEYKWGGQNIGLYGGDDPEPPFNCYLDRMATAGVLPKRFNAAKRLECKRTARDESGDCCIDHAVEKADIQEKYKDDFMPMQLRVLAETVLGYNVQAEGEAWW